MSSIPCAGCEAEIPDRVAFICGDLFGDEYIEPFYRCGICGAYTRKVYRDRFFGEGQMTLQGPIEAEVAESQIALMRRCPAPSDEDCRCAAHEEYFHPSNRDHGPAWGTGM